MSFFDRLCFPYDRPSLFSLSHHCTFMKSDNAVFITALDIWVKVMGETLQKWSYLTD